MKKFNVCSTYGQTFLRGTKNAVEIPMGAFYGKDADGLWYVLDTKPVVTDGGTVYMELYRFTKSRWQVGYESGETVDLIFRIATKNNLWNIPQKKCLHMYGVVQSRTKTPGSRHTKSKALKEVSGAVADRGSYSNIYHYQ